MKSGFRELRSAILFPALSFLILTITLTFVTETPRSRLNVMQVVSILFVVALLFSFRRPVGNEQAGRDESPRFPGLGLALGLTVWLATLSVGFVSDDFAHLYRASHNYLHELKGLLFEGEQHTFMRPLGFASLFTDHALWGSRAAGYHLTNLLIHFLSTVGFYVLNRTLGVQRNRATFVAAIFACMPIQVEAVAWIGARFDLLSVALTIWAMVFYVWFRQNGRIPVYIAAVLLYVLAVFSKENAFVLPLLLLAVDLTPSRPHRFRAAGGLLCVGALAIVYRFYALGSVGGYVTDNIPSIFHIDSKTFEGLIVRGPAQLLTGINWEQPPEWIAISLASLWVATLLFIGFVTRPSSESRRFVKLGVIWALLAMLPAHFLLMVGPSLTNSRVLYMATAGVALILGHLVLSLPRPARNPAALVLALLLPLGALHNIRAWRWTSYASKEFISEVVRLQPSVQPQTEFVFSNTPDTIRGVFFFHVGLTEALRLAYGRDDLRARREDEAGSGALVQARFHWKGDPEQLVELDINDAKPQ